jgi:hypothetical protein
MRQRPNILISYWFTGMNRKGMPTMRVGPRLSGWLILSLAALCSPVAARADFVTTPQTRSVPLQDTNWSVPTPFDSHGNPTPFNKFIPTQISGLKAVIIDVTWKAESMISMKFTTASTITVSATGSLVIDGPNGLALPINLPSPLFSNSESVQKLSPTSVNFATKIFTGSSRLVLTDAASLKLFISQRSNDLTFTIPMSATAFTSYHTSSGNGFGLDTTKVSATISISFVVTPEPGSLTLFGLGGSTCIAFCMIRRRSTPLHTETI